MDMIKKRMAMRGQSGFTLVELLVAVAILAILAGVAVFAVGNLTDSAETSSNDVELKTVRTAAAAWQSQTGAWPTTIDNLVDGNPPAVEPLLDSDPNCTYDFPSAGQVTQTCP
jgi:general secretion pathway protein G